KKKINFLTSLKLMRPLPFGAAFSFAPDPVRELSKLDQQVIVCMLPVQF
ncbi:MAG: hypothetical protein ACJAZ1_001677, partial [Yoonia sp.]